MISILAVVFALSLTRDIRLLAAVYIMELLLSYASGIEVGFFIKRVWLFIPLFTGIIAIPMIFNVFLPGAPVYKIAYLGPGAHLGPILLQETIYVTAQRLDAAAIFIMRVAVSVSAVVLLFLTTRQQKWVGGRIGYILMRSLDTSERVHMAMLSRGFNGDVKILQDFHVGTRDYIAGISAVSLSLLLILASQCIITI
jgi:cobalt/nickel transport system permease protein